ncbi:MAG: HdeD family acid-resistance protein [Terriglobales bacterium]
MATNALVLEFRDLRHKWGWLLALGICMVILGTIALILSPAATLGTVLVLGWLLVISGVIETIQAFRVRKWAGIFLHLIGGVLGVLVGLLIVTHPLAGALVFTLLLASFFTVIGIFRLVTAIHLKFPHWGWAALDGAVTLVLGIMLWIDWPGSGLWFLGFAVGVSLLFRGWSYVMFAFAVRSLPVPVAVRQAA